ncbi:MAG: flagellar basal body rod modification protein [Rhodobacteraceae bacterium]|nr:flagellar basal body rod modification protein [Paracoccaceae bacterium]
MDSVTSTNTATPQTAQTTATATSEASDYETFLKMLTVQMQNQDPLNPVESSDFAAQLANFSSVEQQVLTNDLLTSIAARLANSDFAALADWVGMEARSANAAYFDGEAITVPAKPDPAADRSELVVKDANGLEIYRSAVDSSVSEVTWSGLNQSGVEAPSGLYSLHLEGFSSGESLGLTSLETYGRVQEARIGDDGLTLILAGGQTVLADDVTALRAPS